MNSNGSVTTADKSGKQPSAVGQILPGHENKPVPVSSSMSPTGQPRRFWTADRKQFTFMAVLVCLGPGLFHLYCNDWHIFSPNHVLTHVTGGLILSAFLCFVFSMLVFLFACCCEPSMFVLPNVLAGVVTVTATVAGLPIASWFKPGADLSHFREFELFFMVFFTGTQLAMLASEYLSLSDWLEED